jgi:hypothetical protein
MSRSRRNNAPKKKDITLMTILAYEATDQSRELLRKYNKPDAANVVDLEAKLAELYFSVEDKIQLEREMAEIHPHSKWIAKYMEPVIKEVIVNVPTPAAPVPEMKSNADGQLTPPAAAQIRPVQIIDYIALISVIGIIGLSFYSMSKNK